jgi:hypothetical protein
MNLQAEKIELAKQLFDVKSKVILNQIKALLAAHKTDLWDDLTDEQKASIKKAKTQLLNGEGVSHKEAMKNFKKWRTK